MKTHYQFGSIVLLLTVLSVGAVGTGCQSLHWGQYPSSNIVAQITSQYIDTIEPLGHDKAMHFSASLALTTSLPGNQNPFVGNLRTELAALRTGLIKELNDHYRGEAAKAELQVIVENIDEQYRLLNGFMSRNDIGAGDSLGDLLADQIGVCVGTSFSALRQLKFNDNYNPN